MWVIDPQGRSATVYRSDGSACFLRDDEELDGEDVLRGLRIWFASLFE